MEWLYIVYATTVILHRRCRVVGSKLSNITVLPLHCLIYSISYGATLSSNNSSDSALFQLVS